MANYSVLKAAVQAVVKTNGNQEITGANMQSTLISIINSLGTGYQFMGVATPSTSPGTPDYNVAYIGGAGTYANFGTSVTVPVGSIGVFKYNGSWVKEQIKMFEGIDDGPTEFSNNLVKSGGIYNKIIQEKNLILDDIENITDRLDINRFGYNVTVFGLIGGIHTLTTAVKNVPPSERFAGQKITFKTNSGWVTYQNTSLSTDNYENVNNWVLDSGVNVEGDVTITNNADYEDLTQNNQNELKFADKEYSAATFSGFGRVYLRKNIVSNKNVLTQAMLADENTIYIIQYDYDLNDVSITIPANCVLKFDGGSINNGSVVFNDTIVVSVERAFNDVAFSGTLANIDIDVNVFGAGADVEDNAEILNNLFSLSLSKTRNYIFHREQYSIGSSLELWFGYENRCIITGNEATILQTSDNIPILICHEWCEINNLKLYFENEQSTLNTRAIAIGYSRLVYSTIQNITIMNANTCIAAVLDSETEHPTTDRSMVNCNIQNINTWQISGYFVNLSPNGLPGLTSGTYFNNIYYNITHYENETKNTAIAFCKLTTNSQVNIGEVNIEGGYLTHLFEMAVNACLNIQTLHTEGILLSGHAVEVSASSTLIIGDFNIDYGCKFLTAYSAIFSLADVANVSIGRIKINNDFEVTTRLYIAIPQNGLSNCIIDFLIDESSQPITILHQTVSGKCRFFLKGIQYPFSGNSFPTTSVYDGRCYWKTPENRMAYYINDSWVDSDNFPIALKVGSSSERPTITDDLIGFQYFDTTLNMPIYAIKVETIVLNITTTNYEYTGTNNLTVGNVYTIKTVSGQGKRFGYKNSSWQEVDMQDFSTALTFTALDYPRIYVVSNSPGSSFTISYIDYVWVDATGTTV